MGKSVKSQFDLSIIHGVHAQLSVSQISGRKGRLDPAFTSNVLTDGDRSASPERPGQAADLEDGAPLAADGFFSLRHCDSASLSSFSLDTPSLPRRPHAQEDTDSLVSTGTLVPEAIYLPPAGHRLVTHNDWDALNSQVWLKVKTVAPKFA